MTRPTRSSRAFLRYAGYGLLVLVLLFAGLIGFLGFTDAGARFVVSKIEGIAAGSGQVVAVRDPSGLLTGRLRAGAITLADEKGVYGEIEGLAVDWSPLSLIGLRFNAERVAASSISLHRLPESKSADPSAETTFTLPVEIHIDALDVPELAVSAAVAGREQVLSLSGSGHATADRIAVKLAAAERDRPEARAAADIVYDPAANELRLEADVAEPADGLIAGLLRLPGSPAVAIRLTGEGPLSQWQGRLTAALDGEERLRLDGRHDLSTAGLHRIALAGGGAFDALMPPQLRPLFAGETGIDITVAFDGPDMLRIEKGDISTGAMALAASGTVSARGENDLSLRLAGRDGPVDFRWPLDGGEARVLVSGVEASLSGAAETAVLDATATLASAALPLGRVEDIRITAKSAGLDLARRSGPIEVTVATGATQFASADLDRLVRGPVKLAAKVGLAPDRIAFDPVTLESASIGGALSGEHGLESGATAAQFRLFALPSVLPEALAGKFGTTLALEGRLTRSGEGALDVTGLRMVSDTLEAGGSLSLDAGQVKAALSGKVLALGRLLADASGEAAFELSASGALDAPDVSGRITSSGAKLAGRTLSDLVVTLSGKAAPDNPAGTLKATGALDGQAIDVSAEVASQNGRIGVPVLAAKIGPNTLKGALALGADFLPEGTVRFDFPDLALLAAMAGEKASGDLAGDVVIATRKGKTTATVKASGSGIAREDVRIVRPAVDLAVADLAAAAISGTVKAERVSSGENRLDALALAFKQEKATTGFDLSGRFDGKPLKTKGRVEQRAGGLDIALDSFEATPRGIALKLAKPTRIGVANGAAKLDGLAIRAGKGTVSVSGRAGETLDLSIRLDAVPAALADAFSPGLAAEGAIGGTVTVKGKAASPAVDYALTWDKAATSQTKAAGLGALKLAAKGEFANNRLGIDTTLTGGNGLSFKGGGTVGIGGAMPLSLKFKGTVPFALLQAPLAEQGFTLTGNAAVDLSVSGNAAQPAVNGTVSAKGARLVDVRRNLAVENLSFDIALDGRQAVIRAFSGKIASGGTVSASGTVGIQPASGFPVDVAVKLAKVTYVDGSLVSATVGGDLTLKGPALTGLTLGGRIRIAKANINIPQKLPASLSEIDIKHRNAPAAVERMAADLARDEGGGGSGASRGIGLDLTISASDQIFVRGRGVNAEFAGSLHITGTSSAPSISGAFELERGRLEILNRRLDFTSARIGFAGGLVPTVDLVAKTSVDSTSITVTVSGVASNPSVTFASSPALPQDEILAQLIFRRSMSNLSALQIAQLAAAANELAGGRSSGLLNSLRSKLGVDDLDITTDAEGRAQVSAGKYLNDRTYIELKQDPESSGAKAVINLDIGRGLKLRGEAGSGGGAGAGIFYEKEY